MNPAFPKNHSGRAQGAFEAVDQAAGILFWVVWDAVNVDLVSRGCVLISEEVEDACRSHY